MVLKLSLILLFSVSCFLNNVSSRPSHNESTPLKVEIPVENTAEDLDKVERSIYFQTDSDTEIPDETTQDIIDKIRAINDGLKKPHRQQIKYYKPQTGGGYVIDTETLEKIQQAIASGKLHPYSESEKQQDTNNLQNEEEGYKRYLDSRAIKLRSNLNLGTPFPYIMNIPVVIMPQNFESYNNLGVSDNLKTTLSNDVYQTRQGLPTFPSFPSLPSFPSFPFQNFQLSWPFAQYFPFIVKDPFQAFLQGGGWNNLIEYGQSADVCTRKQKSADRNTDEYNESSLNDANVLDTIKENRVRQDRALKKRTVSNRASSQHINEDENPKKIYVTKPITTNTKKTTKKPYVVEELEEVKNEESGDLRFPFGDFGWFGNKKPVAPSPGFFINKLRVRKGGVAIAGPGGVATAGRGGTAIVGPGGLAYTQPGGLAVAGPAARVVALSPDADINSLITRIQQDHNESVPRSQQPIREGNDSTQYLPFYGGAKGQYLEIKKDTRGSILSEKIVSEESIANENILKSTEDNLQSKVFAANLIELKSLSSSVLKLYNLGKRLGYLGDREKERFKTQLAALEETASNSVKIIDEVGEDVDVLFKKTNPATTTSSTTSNLISKLRKYGENYDDDVGEEGVSIGAQEDSNDNEDYSDRGIISEAKPIGLAVVGEYGLAASRPLATAVAASGVAIARPIATAIAGLDPNKLGIDFQLNHQQKSIKIVRKSKQ